MKLKLPTIIFGAALSVVALGMMGPRAFAANQDVSTQINATGVINAQNNFNFTISGSTAGIEATDYVVIDFENLLSPFLNEDIVYRGQVIGKYSRTYENFLDTKTSGKPVNESVDLQNSRGNSKITFTENITKFDRFEIKIDSGGRSSANIFVDKDFDFTAKILKNGQTVAEKTLSQSKKGITKFSQTGMRFVSRLNTDTGRVYIEPSIRSKGDNPIRKGDVLRLAITDSSRFELIEKDWTERTISDYWSFIPEGTPKNSKGIYFKQYNPPVRIRYRTIGNVMEVEILEDLPNTDSIYSAAIYDIFNIKSVTEKELLNKSTTVAGDVEILRGGVAYYTEKGMYLDFVGNGSSNTFAVIKEGDSPTPEISKEDMENEEKPEESPKEKSDPSPEIQAPNTGAQSGIFPILLSGAIILGVVSAILWRRRG